LQQLGGGLRAPKVCNGLHHSMGMSAAGAAATPSRCVLSFHLLSSRSQCTSSQRPPPTHPCQLWPVCLSQLRRGGQAPRWPALLNRSISQCRLQALREGWWVAWHGGGKVAWRSQGA
jgi:hypothetical protein